jgi:hypothetical protein
MEENRAGKRSTRPYTPYVMKTPWAGIVISALAALILLEVSPRRVTKR